jgi:hypothetical protein
MLSYISANPGFFVLQPYRGDTNELEGYMRLPVIAWKLLEHSEEYATFTLNTPVVLGSDMDDGDLSKAAILAPSGQVLKSVDYFYESADAWFEAVKRGECK